MKTNQKKSFSHKEAYTEPNANLKIKTKYNLFNYNTHNKSPINFLPRDTSSSHNKSQFRKLNSYYNNSRNNFMRKNNSFSFKTNQQFLWKKRSQSRINSSLNFFDNSIITNENKSIYDASFLNITKPILNESKITDNKNQNLPHNFKINKLLDNRNNNSNKLKTKFEKLIDLALKNENKDCKIKNNIKTKKLTNIEMTIERIRNKNRTEIFKKKIEINIPNRRVINNNIESIKKNLSQKLFDKLNKSQNYSSNNFNDTICFGNKRNKSFKNSFMHLNEDLNYKRARLNNSNCYNRILNTQNIYRPNNKIDYYKKMVENKSVEKNDESFINIYTNNSNNNIINNKNYPDIKYKLKNLTSDLKFFESKHKIYIK